jgi:lactate permease
MDFFLSALPILFLIVAMTKPRPLPSTMAFLGGAVLAFFVRWLGLQTSPHLLVAAVCQGLLDALTPISIVFGAILFFVAMERSGALGLLQSWLTGISPNPVAQIMIGGFCFIFLIEAAAGFGTPAALAAPILVSLGFPVLRVAVVCLVFNTIPTAFGAAGTPVWFGFELLGLPTSTLLEVGKKAAFLQFAVGLVVPVLVLRMLVDWKTIRANFLFIVLAILSCTVPMVLVASVSYEFPAIVGGVIGVTTSILLAKAGFGLARGNAPVAGTLFPPGVFRALLPLGLTVVILLVTRIPALGLRQLLTARQPALDFMLPGLGEFSISSALVLQMRGILGTDLSWSHAVLYVPSIIPFVLTAALALFLFRRPAADWTGTLFLAGTRIVTPVLALFGALVFVNLLMVGGTDSATMILGTSLAGATGDLWSWFAPFLGALGSFFSGSTTISNLTFGPIQESIALDTGLSLSTLLALQLSGAAMGNAICIHNIVAVCAVLGLQNKEGAILRQAAGPVLLYGLILIALLVLAG